MNVALTLRRAHLRNREKTFDLSKNTLGSSVSPRLLTHPKWRLEYQTSHKGNDHQLNKLLIFEQILLVSILGNV